MSAVLAYAGVGSRETPEIYREDIMRIVKVMCDFGYTLRSGGATGADEMFETACVYCDGRKEIYLPWDGFNNYVADKDHFVYQYSHQTASIARQFHPKFYRMGEKSQKLIARNGHQIFGASMLEPVMCVICWTPDAAPVGGTGQAIRIATFHRIPIFNLGFYDNLHDKFPRDKRMEQFHDWIKKIQYNNILAARGGKK